VLDGLDGLLLTVGADIDAARYGRPRGAEDDAPRADRDAWEFALADAALSQGLPVLGICRGLQVLNVLLGGTLVQHLGDHDATHEADSKLHRPTPGVFNTHRVTTAPGSRVADVLGEGSDASCAHHQAIDDLAERLVATAWAGDGVIEAVELPGESWVVAVQGHPEVTGGGPLLDAFVGACRAHRDSLAGVAAG
jgi:putative glutamine amidotransferase